MAGVEMSLRCFFGIHDYKLIGREEATAHYRTLFIGETSKDGFAEVWKCRRCPHVEGRFRGPTHSENIDPVFLTAIRNDLCDECGKKGCSRQAPDYWPKDTPGVPNDAVYCNQCWEAVDKELREDGHVLAS